MRGSSGLRALVATLCMVTFVNALPFGWFTKAPQRRATVCNGRAEFCSRKYSEVSYIGAHNSYAFDKDVIDLARNQEVDVPTQLSLGIRLLQGQSHVQNGELRFCHTDCRLFDGGLVVDYLKLVKTFLDNNPNEVLTLLFTNPDGASVKDLWEPAFDEAGVSPFAYVPPSLPVKFSDWPTLGELIDSGKRVIVFMDANANTADVNFILPEFDMVWETPFSVTDDTFPCKVDRITGALSPADHMYMINHSLNVNIIPIGDGVIVPDFTAAKDTNSADSIIAHATGCEPLSGNNKPTFVLLDWVDIGEASKAADTLNGF